MNNIVNEYLFKCICYILLINFFHDHELNLIFTLVTVFINTIQWHIMNYNNKKSLVSFQALSLLGFSNLVFILPFTFHLFYIVSVSSIFFHFIPVFLFTVFIFISQCYISLGPLILWTKQFTIKLARLGQQVKIDT